MAWCDFAKPNGVPSQGAECGIVPPKWKCAERIIGGSEACAHSIPWHVGIVLIPNKSNKTAKDFKPTDDALWV